METLHLNTRFNSILFVSEEAKAPPFKFPVRKIEATTNVGRYRQASPGGTTYIAYQLSDVATYVTQKYVPITSKFRPQNGFEWRLGFYFGMDEDNKLNFYVVPTLFDVDQKKYLDFFDNANAARYELLDTSVESDDENEVVYDFGHMEP